MFQYVYHIRTKVMGINFLFTLQEISCKYADIECSTDYVRSELFGGYGLYMPII